jgi:hypothetical protein
MRRSRKPIDGPAHMPKQLLRLLNSGEVLLWSGDKAGAAKQFAVAIHFDITPFEKSELTKVGAGRG